MLNIYSTKNRKWSKVMNTDTVSKVVCNAEYLFIVSKIENDPQ